MDDAVALSESTIADDPSNKHIELACGSVTHSTIKSFLDNPRMSYYGSHSTRSSTRCTSSDIIQTRENSAAPTKLLISHSISPSHTPRKAELMRSTLLDDLTIIDKSWTRKKVPYARVARFITYSVAFLGIVASAVHWYLEYKNLPMLSGNLCMVLNEEFDTNTDTVFGPGENWFREVQLGGFGNGEFEMTTSSSNNSYVQNGYLYITPTLTSDVIGIDNVLNGYTYNLTGCTYGSTDLGAVFDSNAYHQECSAVSDSTTGSVINPVQSARISTRNSASIRYGRVEVRAKLPRGDWFWPAIWMMPVNNTYGPWPLSGEIDIMESRGNGRLYPFQGINHVRGSLNWGPVSILNVWYKTFGLWAQHRTDYGAAFHNYVLEWDSNFVRIYVDSRLNSMLEVTFDKSFFARGDFPRVVENGTTPIVVQNPWVNGTNATPFDQPFYLILNLAVGGTSGWFPDNVGGKPWSDESSTAMRDFVNARDQWYPTWGADAESRSFIIDHVKMWQLC